MLYRKYNDKKDCWSQTGRLLHPEHNYISTPQIYISTLWKIWLSCPEAWAILPAAWRYDLLFMSKVSSDQQMGNKITLAYYPTSRTQAVQIVGSSSEVLQVQKGVPQSPVLGPLFFPIYINNLGHSIKNSTLHMSCTAQHPLMLKPFSVYTSNVW